MENKRIFTYIAVMMLACSFIGSDMIVHASETDEPLIQDIGNNETDQNDETFEILPQEDEIEIEETSDDVSDLSLAAENTHAGSDDANHEHGPRPSGRSSSEIKDTIETAPQIVEHPEVIPYVLAGTDYDTPVYSCSAKLPDGAVQGTITFTWYVDGNAVSINVKPAVQGEEITDTYTADGLKNLTGYGVHPVYCVVSMDVETTDEDGNPTVSTVSNQSMSANFIVCNGINNQALLTFSDVHEAFSNIGKAINNIMQEDDKGLIPGLIVCTGDWKNSEHWMGGDKGSDNYNKTKEILISRLYGQSGGIDTVFVSGNHENGPAARDENIKINLGVDSEYDGVGVIFDGREIDTAQNSGSSKEMTDLIVFGINYENMQTDTGYSYETVLPRLEQFLEELRSSYAGQLIVVSAHAGLHVVDNWGGRDQYNIDKSNEMVALLNKYADQGMNITFLFGHDHSRREEEMILVPGEEITSTVSYSLKDINEAEALQTQILKFTYGHAGYITNSIGGKQRYTVIEWTDLKDSEAIISRSLYELDSEGTATVLEGICATADIITSYHFTEPDQTFSWHKGEAGGLELKADADFETVFIGVMVDRQVIDVENYIIEADGITLKADYLNTLAGGQHTLKLLFINDTEFNSNVETTFTVTGNQQSIHSEHSVHSSTPKTGIENDLWFWTASLGISMYGMTLIYRKRKQAGH